MRTQLRSGLGSRAVLTLCCQVGAVMPVCMCLLFTCMTHGPLQMHGLAAPFARRLLKPSAKEPCKAAEWMKAQDATHARGCAEATAVAAATVPANGIRDLVALVNAEEAAEDAVQLESQVVGSM